MSSNLLRRTAAVLALAITGSAWAAPVAFRGVDNVSGSQIPPGSQSLAARQAFDANFGAGISIVEDFERSDTAGWQVGGKLSIGSGKAGLTASGWNRIDKTPQNGRFNTTANGANWWETSEDFVIDFTSNVWAFGFYGTDFADFGGSLTMDLFRDGTQQYSMSVVDGLGQADGSLLFFGFVDTSGDGFDSIRVTVQQSNGGADYIGFDDFVFVTEPGTQAPVDVPEPATLALAGLALAGAALGRRRRSSR